MKRYRKNPDVELPPDAPRDFKRGVEKYEEFHDFDPKNYGPLSMGQLPTTVYYAGRMLWTAYASDKWERRNHNYIHDHDHGPKVYVASAASGVRAVSLPEWLRNVKTFVKLGRCIGLGFKAPDGNEIEAQGDGTTELYTTPNGKALVVIEGKRRLEAIVWGGNLNVKAAGIVH
jgi:hypothetical protein